MPSVPTVSRCAQSRSVRPPPEPAARTSTLGRPGVASSVLASRPAARAQPATKRAISASPAPPGTSAGLTESMATRSAVRAARSVRTTAILAIGAAWRNRLPSAASAYGSALVAHPRPQQAAGVRDEALVLVCGEGARDRVDEQGVEGGRLDVGVHRLVHVGEMVRAELLVALVLEVVLGECAVALELLLVPRIRVADGEPRFRVERHPHRAAGR